MKRLPKLQSEREEDQSGPSDARTIRHASAPRLPQVSAVVSATEEVHDQSEDLTRGTATDVEAPITAKAQAGPPALSSAAPRHVPSAMRGATLDDILSGRAPAAEATVEAKAAAPLP